MLSPHLERARVKITIKKSLDRENFRSYLVYRNGKLTNVTLIWLKYRVGGEYTIKHEVFLGTTTRSFKRMAEVRAYLKTIG